MIHLVIGGARSGKSRYAEQLAQQCAQDNLTNPTNAVTYMATATVYDDEMGKRVAMHQQQRPQHWSLVEAPLHLADALSGMMIQAQQSRPVVLIDCLTLWLSNWLCAHSDEVFIAQRQRFIDALQQFDGDCFIVSNEVGSGIVPMGELSRRFADQAGWLNQAVARISDHTTLVVAGLPLVLKSN